MTSLEIQAFLTVQQTLSISRAAEQLYISQSSLSSRLQTLEQELGAPLFVRGRGRRELSLTAEDWQMLLIPITPKKNTRALYLRYEGAGEWELKTLFFAE